MTPRRALGSPFSLILRETGLALAVLALWMLALLAPLHQTSGLLREMARAGIDTGPAWSICQADSDISDNDDHALPVCPAQGIGKSELLLPPPVALAARIARLLGEVSMPSAAPRIIFDPRLIPLQPRAPPSLI